jgi:hypothetical protein
MEKAGEDRLYWTPYEKKRFYTKDEGKKTRE